MGVRVRVRVGVSVSPLTGHEHKDSEHRGAKVVKVVVGQLLQGGVGAHAARAGRRGEASARVELRAKELHPEEKPVPSSEQMDMRRAWTGQRRAWTAGDRTCIPSSEKIVMIKNMRMKRLDICGIALPKVRTIL